MEFTKENVVNLIRTKAYSTSKLAGLFEVGRTEVLSLMKILQLQYEVETIIDSQEGEIRFKMNRIPTHDKLEYDMGWDGSSIVRFGLLGDTHFNSKYVQMTYLHDFYDILYEEGITDVYHTGDIDEGERMRPGHQYECYTQGADEHAREIIKKYPQRNGITTHFIIGNHDEKMIMHLGYNIGKAIDQKRNDMNYLGASSAIVNLTPKCTMELMHPADGTAYAISYKTQKRIEGFSGGEKPNILAIGHYHKSEYIFYRNVHAFQTGCFLAQTPWMKRKGIAAMVGGWIVEVHVNKEGTIKRLKSEWIPYYKHIPQDYLNWR